MERRERRESLYPVGHHVVNEHRFAESDAAVDHPVPDCGDARHAGGSAGDGRGTVFAELAQLEAARASADGEDAHVRRSD